ncbi:amidohydrolase family protein [uncultured Jatrophihabitans sp.]|uniref:amidohydrolase family protein n=1 Tax=uncultured Jatrophihabitans sp. TaxID=1610747 RepID=UPI0035C9E6BA
MNELNELLRDVDHRIPEMDLAGIDVQVLSNTSPVADRAEAVRAARRSNDEVAEMVARHPSRLRGFASLPTQDPAAAAAERH